MHVHTVQACKGGGAFIAAASFVVASVCAIVSAGEDTISEFRPVAWLTNGALFSAEFGSLSLSFIITIVLVVLWAT